MTNRVPSVSSESWSGGNERGESWYGGRGSLGSRPAYGTAKNAAGLQVRTPLMVVYKQSWTDVAASTTNGVLTTTTGKNGAGTRNITPNGTLAAGFDYARNVVVTVTHASSVVAETIVVTGVDQHGFTISETLQITATGTSKTATGNVAFKKITNIAETVAADASANSIVVGTGNKLGLDRILDDTQDVFRDNTDGAVSGTAGTLVAASVSANADLRGTVTPNTAPNGSHDYAIYYFVADIDHLQVQA